MMTGQGWPSISNICGDRSPRASRCRSSRFSPPGGDRWLVRSAIRADRPDRCRRHRRPGAGKPIGILTATFLASKLTGRSLQKGLTWPDLTGVALLGGIGFTVSLLIGELSFGGNAAADDHVKIAVLTGSMTAAVLAALLLRMRNRRYRAMCKDEARDADNDGIPDMYQREQA